MADGQESTLVPLSEPGSLPPLYCVHPVSGSPYGYSVLTRTLGADQPVFGFEAPGFDGIGEPAADMAELAERHVASLRAARPHGPYHLLGWSLGGVVAYEMARRLTAAGERVPVLVLVDSPVPEPIESWPLSSMLPHFLRDLLGLTAGRTPELDAALAGLGDDSPLVEWFAAAERSGQFPEELDAEFLEERFTLFEAHVSLLMRHRIEAVHQGTLISVMAAESDPAETRWGPLATRVEEHTVPGDHHSMWTGRAWRR